MLVFFWRGEDERREGSGADAADVTSDGEERTEKVERRGNGEVARRGEGREGEVHICVSKGEEGKRRGVAGGKPDLKRAVWMGD